MVYTNAFQAVLGTDFLTNPRVGGLLTQPPPTRLLVDGEAFSVEPSSSSPQCHRIYRMFKKESYALTTEIRNEVLQLLEVPKMNIRVDTFANHKNAQESLYMTRENSAWRYNWSKLTRKNEEILWANPPFSQMSKVVTKLCLEPCKMVLVYPNWVDQYWYPILEKISVAKVQVPSGVKLYKSDWDDRPLPAPQWNTCVSLVDTTSMKVDERELDPKIVKFIQKSSKNWNLDDLQREMMRYPRYMTNETMDQEIQVDVGGSI